MGEVLDGLHAGEAGGFDVVEAVVDEEDLLGWGVEALGGVGVDFGFGLGDFEGVGPGAVVEVGEPGELAEDADVHAVAEVGKDAGADAGVLEGLGPLDHGDVEVGPEVGVGVEEVEDFGVGEGWAAGAGGEAPEVLLGGDVAAVVGVAVGPVFAVEGGFVERGDEAHALPGGGVGRAGEDEAVVEEDGGDLDGGLDAGPIRAVVCALRWGVCDAVHGRV